jgi:hypothetical protein
MLTNHGSSSYNLGCRCETCTDAHTAKTQAVAAGWQKDSQAAAENKGKVWTGVELEIVARADLTVREASALLGRTYFATALARHKVRHDPKTIGLAGLGATEGAKQ